MNRNAFGIAHQAYLEAPYQAAYDEQDRIEAAIEECGDEESVKYLREEIAESLDNFIDWQRLEADLSASVPAVVAGQSPERWNNLATMIGLGILRDMQERLENPTVAKAIAARCIARAEEYARDAI
jgi:hypothetical protein